MPSQPDKPARETIIVRAALIVLGAVILLFFLIFFLTGENFRPSTQRGLFLVAVGTVGLAVVGAAFQTHIVRTLKAVREDAHEQHRHLAAYLHSRPVSQADVLALTGLMLVGMLLRGLFVTQPIRTDEAVTYLHYASRSLPLALSNYSAPNNHLLHTFFSWISVHMLGNTELALRLPAFVMGVLLIPVTYGVGRVMANRRAGLVAAGLVTVSSVLIEYSTNARGYTLQCALFGVSIIVASKTRHSLSPTRWGLLSLVLALGFFTVPTTLYAFGGLMLWLLIEITHDREKARASFMKFLMAWLICGFLTVFLTFLLYTPVLIVSGLNAVIANQYVQPFTFDVFLQHLPEAASKLWAHWHMSIPIVITALLGLSALIGLVVGEHGRRRLLISCVIFSMAVLCVQRVIPFERSWLPLLPLYFVSAAAGLVWLWDRWAGRPTWMGWLMSGLLILSLGVNITITRSPYLSIETGTFRDAKAIVQDLQMLLQPGDRVVLEHPSGDSLAYYAYQVGLDWETYAEGRNNIYVVINTEYPQTLESVARLNWVELNQYAVATIRTYPQGALVRLEPLP